ncbi:MAG: tRNA pseudouridine(55) synthase TruB [Eubacteriaceae bacterium]|jgi:tRNA pseudouridine55 synthase|nr:tRNA pseudouridine(55) synthase TruB [Eubacteriaceae bacterium]
MDGIVILNKPAGISSFAACSRVKKITGSKKSGHCGTLDPMAQGVLVVALGFATRISSEFLNQGKEYIADIHFGAMTDTLDIWGSETAKSTASGVSADELEAALKSFLGESMQKPPAYAAIKVAGKASYKYAREGIALEHESRPITISKIEMVSECLPQSATLRVECSKGTYIRSLCKDIGEALGQYAVMGNLTRTRSGQFSLDDSVGFEALELAAQIGDFHSTVIDPLCALSHMPQISLTEAMYEKTSRGNWNWAPAYASAYEGKKAALEFNGKLAGIAMIKEGKICPIANHPNL